MHGAMVNGCTFPGSARVNGRLALRPAAMPRRPVRRPPLALPATLTLLLAGTQPAMAIKYYDYNASVDFEVNSNLLMLPGNEDVASGYRFSSSHILGYETPRSAWSIAPSLMVQRLENAPRAFGEQEFFNVAAAGRHDWTDRLSTRLNVMFELDRNLLLPDPAILFLERPILRQGRQVTGGATYRLTERLSASVNGTYLDNLFEEVPGVVIPLRSFDYQDVTTGGNYIWNERLSFNVNVGVSRFKDFEGITRNNDRFFNVGTEFALAEHWTFSGSAGLRATQQTGRVFLPGPVVPGPVVLLGGRLLQFDDPDGTVDPSLDLIFGGLPIVVVGGVPRLRIQEPIVGVQVQDIVTNTYDFSLTRTGERLVASAGFRRRIQPAGIAAQTEISSASADLRYRFSERLNGGLHVDETTLAIQGQGFGGEGRTVRVLTTNLNYLLTEQLSLTATYRYFQAFGDAFGFAFGDADGQAVVVSLSYNGDRWEW